MEKPGGPGRPADRGPETRRTRPPRALRVLRGPPAETAAGARTVVEGLPGPTVLWIGADAPPAVEASTPRRLVDRLGRSFDAVVLDLHGPVDADVLGQVPGFLRAGGTLVVRTPPAGAAWPPSPALRVDPFDAADVGDRFARRVCAALADARTDLAPAAPGEPPPGGTPEQAALVETLATRLADPRPTISVLVADRGRGKSAALGLALRAAGVHRAVITAGLPESAAEVERFGEDAARFVPLAALLHGAAADPTPEVLVVDEAAQLPVPVLQRLVQRYPEARLAFATTARGYEGTGRGFVLRFLAWVRTQPRPVDEHTLTTPIRFDADDPLEDRFLRLLALDASPAALDPARVSTAATRYAVLDRDALAADEGRLREVFGLLVHAHYRTTPGDLHRALDAPNLSLHVLLWEDHVVSAALMALEGGLAPALCADMAAGRTRIRGHALADTLVTHGARPDAGTLRMLRSVRIATHPDLRRLGLARRLVEAIHHACDPKVDLVGTVFGATPELLAFRRSLDYTLVRVGVSRGTRTGEPAAVMVRPVSAVARALVAKLRGELARSLPTQLALQGRDELVLDPALVEALGADLPATPPPTTAEVDTAVATYLGGPVTCETAAWALGPWLVARAAALETRPPNERRLLEARLLRGLSWAEATAEAGYASVPAAMRAMRPAVRALADLSGPGSER